MNIRKCIGWGIYYVIGKHLPRSTAFIVGKVARAVRGFCAKLILSKTGNNINIEKGAVFSSRCTIGNNSGIGINAKLGGEIHIGENVLMGPECVILTRNHSFHDKNRLIRE